MKGRCPYCTTEHATFDQVRDCSNACWETRVKPLGHELAIDVLQGRVTLAEAEAR